MNPLVLVAALTMPTLEPAVGWWLVCAFAVLVAVCWRAWYRDIDARRAVEAENRQLRIELAEMTLHARDGWADAVEGWESAKVEAQARHDAAALDRLHAMAAREGLTEWPWGEGVTNDPRYS